MKILLVGEYSRLHNSLKEGLLQLGHEVTIIGSSGDGFKNYPIDVKLEAPFFKSKFGNIIRQVVFRLAKYDLASWELLENFNKISPELSGFDVVQLINESPFLTSPNVERQIISYLKDHNKKLFLLSCGDDYVSVTYALSQKPRYSIFTPLKENPGLKHHYAPSLKYTTPKFKELHKFVYSIIDGVIATDMDYHIPLKGNKKYLGLIPNPVNTDEHEFNPIGIDDKVNVLLGVNSTNHVKKGVPLFKKALKRLQEKHSEKIDVKIIENLPYAQYIDHFDKAHIILDQVYSFDQGYNALEAMAKGKVVFTGAEKEFYRFYDLKNKVAINTTPDEEALFTNLEHLVLNPDDIVLIAENARKFIEKEHDYRKIAQRYLDVYSLSSDG